MDRISNIKISKFDTDSIYIKPVRMFYEQDGKTKSWDLMKGHDSVCAVIFNISRKVLMFVKQFRPAVYYARAETSKDNAETIDVQKYPPSLGMTIELCAGIVDKDQSLAEIMKTEILEECGYEVPISAIEKVTSYRCGVGTASPLETLFYAELTDAMKVSQGGGNYNEGEYIEVVEMSLTEAEGLVYDESVPRPGSLLVGLQWFFSKNNTKTIIENL